MEKRRLNSEQIDLLHHVELSDAGWQDRVLDQLVLAKAISADVPMSIELYREGVAAVTGENIGADRVDRAVLRLVSSRALHEVSSGLYSASQATRAGADQARAQATAAEAAAQRVFEELIEREAPTFERSGCWAWFCESCLHPLIDALGARTYELLTPTRSEEAPVSAMISYLGSVPEPAREGVKKAVAAFFGTTNVAVRQFVLRHLHAHLLGMAIGLPKRSLDALQHKASAGVRLLIFLDTNFLFSILDLHDNPANEAARELLKLLKGVAKRINVVLYVSPLTVDESRRTIAAYEAKLRDVPVTPKLGRVAAALDGDFSGIVLRFLSAASQATHRLTAKEFFDPYLANFVPVLKGRGIELYNKNTEDLSISQPVVDDILEQQNFEKSKSPKRAKSYEALRHDVTLWHLTTQLRPTVTDTPLDAVYWVATVDYRFLAFDAYKRRKLGMEIPVCVHPTALVQMLQLWLPRTPELDAAMFESLAAMIPQFFDSDSEEMSIRILRALSRFEDVDDLPEETVTSILLNKALRHRMAGSKEVEDEVALLRDAIVSQLAEIKAALDRERSKAIALSAELTSITSQSAEQAAAQAAQLKDEELRRTVAEGALKTEREEASKLSARMSALEASLEAERDQNREALLSANRRRARQVYCWQMIATAIPLALLCPMAIRATSSYYSVRAGMASGIVLSLAMAIWLSVAILVGSRRNSIGTWQAFRVSRRVAAFLLASAWAIFLSVVAGAIWQHLTSAP
jgi:hypothetical protein